MANDFYNESGKPFQASQGLSSAIRAEFTLIRQAFDKLPDVTGNAGKLVQIDPLGSGSLVPFNSTIALTDADTLDGYHATWFATSANLTAHTSDATKHLTSSQNTWIDAVTATATEVNYLSGVTSNIQNQINTKLNSSSYTAADVLTKIKTVDGTGSGLDADTLDGLDSASFSLTGHTHSYLPLAGGTVNGDISVNGVLNTAHQINVGYGEPSLSEIIMYDNVDGHRVMRCDNHIGFLNQAGGWGVYCNDAGDWVCTTRATCANAPTVGTDLANKDYVDTKLTASTYTASDVLTKIKTVDGAGSGLDADTLDGYHASSFLIGSTWTNVIGSRADSVTYTNTTGKTMQVSVKVTLWASGEAHLYIGGVAVSGFSHTTAGTFTFTNMIPPGATYLLLLSGSVAITGWYELI